MSVTAARKGWSPLSHWNQGIHGAVFALLDSGFALVQDLLTTLPFLPFGVEMYILCCYMLEACDLIVDFTGLCSSETALNLRNFGLGDSVETGKPYGDFKR